MSEQLLRVLLVDDEASLREPLTKYLRRECGYSVDTAATGEEALARIDAAQGQYDVAVIDNLLTPQMGCEPEPLGIKLMTEVRARYSNIEYILFTGWGMDSGLDALRAGAYRYIRKPFDPEELAVLIEHAAEHRRLKNAAREKLILEQLMRTSAALLSEHELSEVLDIILHGVQSMGFDRVRLYLISDDRTAMVAEAHVGMDTPFIGLTFPIADDIETQILLDQPRPRVCRRTDGRPLHELLLGREDIDQWACAPLLLRGEVIGKVSVDNKFSKQPISAAELDLVALFVSQAAAAIEKARLRSREQQATRDAERRARQLELLHEIGAVISAALDFDSIMRMTLSRGLQAIRADEGSIMLVNPKTNVLEMQAWIVHGEFMPREDHRNFGNGEGIAGHVLYTAKAYNCPDCQHDPHFVRVLAGRDPASILSVPIISYGRVLGTINADSRELSFFASDDIQFLSALADHLAVVIEAQRLRDFGMVVSTLILEELLAKIVESACILTGTELGTIYLIDGSGTPVREIEFPPSRDVREGPRTQGGLTHLVMTSGEPIIIADAQQDARVRVSVKDEGVQSLMGIPLKVRDEHNDRAEVRTIGVLFVDTLQQREFTRRDLELLQSLASQAAIAIERAGLYEEVAQERDHSEWMSSQLLALQEITKQMQSELDLPSLLDLISRLAAELLDADAAGILLLDAEKQHLTFEGSYRLGAQIVEGTRDLVGGSIAGRVVKTGEPIIAHDIPKDSRFYNPAADGEGLLAIISTPLRVGRTIIGTLDVHSKSDCQAFDADDLQILSLMASQAAVAIENARLFQQTSHHALALETLHLTSLDITSRRQISELVQSILDRAVELLRAKGGALYMLDELGRHAKIVAVSNLPEQFVDITLELGDSVVGRAIQTRTPLSISDYRNWENRLRYYDEYGFTAVAGVPIAWQDKIWGALAIHDDVAGRSFGQEALDLLSHFGNWAAVALENAELAARDTDKLNRLEKLSRANNVIMSNLGTMSLDERLNQIAKCATEILDTESCGIFLVKRTGFISLEASHGHREGGFEKGREFAIRSAIGAGLTGHIAHEGKLFNAHGDNLLCHFAVRGEELPHASSGQCHSLLAIPLKQSGADATKLIGLLRADNKKDRNGQARPLVRFTKEDEWILQLLADAAVVAIEAAGLVTRLQEQQDHLQRLIASSPNGVIAIDLHGKVNVFNAQAQATLGYRPEEVLHRSVDHLYEDSREPNRIGELLHAALDGKLANYETAIRSKEGERIPIRLAATWLYDSQERPIGSVGYFEDLRAIKETEHHLALLLKASNIVTQAEKLTDGLHSLAAMIVVLLNATLCRIFLLDESQQYLLSKAVHPIARSGDGLDWSFEIAESTAIADLPRLSAWLARGRPHVLRAGDSRTRPLLMEWSQRLGMPQDFQWLLVVPLKTHERTVGLLTLGELRDWKRAPLSADKRALTVAIANQTAALIDRMHLHEITDRRRQLLTKMDEGLRQVRAELETTRLLKQIVRRATELLGCRVGGLYINRPHLAEVEMNVVEELPETMIGKRQPHAEGLIGLVARTGKSKIIHNYNIWPDREDTFDQCHFQTVAAVPLRRAGEVKEVLFVAIDEGSRQFSETDLEILERFAMHAEQALHISRLMDREQRMFSQLNVLHHISDYIQAAGDLDKILHVVLTGVTAGYGLGFNRAALLLLDERREYLIGQMGIGHLSESEAQAAWEQHHLRGLEDFGQYLELLEQDRLPMTPVGARIRGLRLPVRAQKTDSFWRAMSERHYTLVTQGELNQLPDSFLIAFEPGLPLVVAPLLAREQVIGFLVVDNKFTRSPITQEAIEALLTFANTAALVIDNTRLYDQMKAARERLRAFYEASNALLASQDPERVLQDTVERACTAASAAGVSVILIDEHEQAQTLAAAGIDRSLNITEVIRPKGLSVQVMRTGASEIIEDTNENRERVNPDWFQRGIAAALCLPLSLEGRHIGVMWFHYEQPRHFSTSMIEAMQLYVNQAAISYDNARRIKEQEQMRQAAEAFARATESQGVLEQIVHSAQEVLQANSAFIWSYDSVRNQFIPENLVAVGISATLWQEFHEEPPLPKDTTYAIMEQGWIGVRDVRDTQLFGFLGEATRKLFKRISVQSFQGIALVAGDEKLGVLYVNYNRLRSFSPEERQTAETFANHAALALKKAKLLEQVSKTRNAARMVAKVTVLENLKSTLQSVVDETRGALGCDAITLYIYDHNKDRLSLAITTGVWYPRRASRFAHVPGNSLVFQMIKHNEMYIVDDSTIDLLFKESRFTRDEQIASCVAIPLNVGSESVGAMFINYRVRHRFTSDELTNIELFAHQAAVAIRNAQLFEQMHRWAGALEALYRAGRIVTGSLDLDKILAAIAEQAYKLTGTYGKKARYCHLALVKEHALEFIAAYPARYLFRIQRKLGIINLDRSEPIGITGRTIRSGQSQLIGDVAQHPDYLEYDGKTRSELAVPIKIGDDVIGVINVEHPDHNAFDEGDQRALEALAAQAAIAIENARLYVQVRQRADQLQILYDTGLKLTSELSIITILQQVVDRARQLTDAQLGALGVRDLGGEIRPFITSGLDVIEKERIGTHPEGKGVLKIILHEATSIRERDIRQHNNFQGYASPHPDIVSFLGVPIQFQGKTIGNLYMANKLGAPEFTQDDQNVLELLAAQAAVAIENARLFEQTAKAFKETDRRLQEELFLHKIALAASSALELDKVLLATTESIAESLQYESVGIQLVDETTQELTGSYYYTGPQPLEINTSRNRGVTGRVVRTRASALIGDVLQDPEYFGAPNIRSEMCVPMCVDQRVVGIINVESARIHAFTEHDLRLMETIAGQVVNWIENARLYTQLEKTKEMLVARTSVAWMGMVSSTWRHAIEGHAMTIAEEILALRSTLPRESLTATTERKLAKIKSVATKILEKPITPPLSSEEGVLSVPINDLLRERLLQLQKNEPYKSVTCTFDSSIDNRVTVRISPEWLRRLFDILIDNAVEATSKSPVRRIAVTTYLDDERVAIGVSDTGSGLSMSVRSKLFREPIPKLKGDKGMGMGLLLAQTIAQTYGGDIRLESTSPNGTRLVVRLPLER
jgi:PAS domain S-box-containing protein